MIFAPSCRYRGIYNILTCKGPQPQWSMRLVPLGTVYIIACTLDAVKPSFLVFLFAISLSIYIGGKVYIRQPAYIYSSKFICCPCLLVRSLARPIARPVTRPVARPLARPEGHVRTACSPVLRLCVRAPARAYMHMYDIIFIIDVSRETSI